MRVKGEVVEAYMQQKQLATGLMRGEILKAHGLSFMMYHKARNGMNLMPKTILRRCLGATRRYLLLRKTCRKLVANDAGRPSRAGYVYGTFRGVVGSEGEAGRYERKV